MIFQQLTPFMRTQNLGAIAEEAKQQKIGIGYEERLRKNFLNGDGTRRDSLLYAIIKHDWQPE